MLRLGYQGVAIFFVISGFLLYRPFVDAAFRAQASPAVGSFWLRRFVRIFPAYWVALFAYIYVFGLFTVHGAADTLTYFGLLQNYRGRYALLGLGVAWTLAIEIGFYLLLPLISGAARVVARGSGSALRMRRVQLALVAVLGAIGLLVKAMNIWFVGRPATAAWLPLNATSYSVFGYLDWFAVGMLMAVLSAWSAEGRPLPTFVDVLASHPNACWLVTFGCFAVQTRVAPGHVLPDNLAQLVLPCVTVIAAGFLVFPAVFGDQNVGGVRAFLQRRSVLFLGTISYGIYLWHLVVFRLSGRWIASGFLPDDLAVRFLVVASVTVAAAAASFHLVERPLVRLSHRASRYPRAEARGIHT